MTHEIKDFRSPAGRSLNLFSQSSLHAKLVGIHPVPLLVSYEATAHLRLFLELVKVVHNDTDEKVENKLRSNDHEQHEEENNNGIIILLGLLRNVVDWVH